jgi:uncharacterized membrane protein
MTFDSWLLAFHLLAAAALIGAEVIFTVLVLAVRRVERPGQVLALKPLLRVASVAIVVGSLGVVTFGVWLAISLDAYKVWDGWVIAALVLWAVASETGRRADPEFAKVFTRAAELQTAGELGPNPELAALGRTQRGLILHVIATAAVLLLLLDMIWKPGA